MTTATSDGKEGAASAAPSTPQEAEELLLAATTPEQVWAIYEVAASGEEDWRIVKLKAEFRYGELLGPVKPGTRTDLLQDVTGSSGADRVAQNRARKVFAVGQENLDAYIADKGSKSTRAGLLREYGEKKEKPAVPKSSKTATPAERLKKKVKYLRSLTRSQVPKWSNEDMDDVDSLLRQKKPGASYASRRVNDIRRHIEAARKSGDSVKFWEISFTANRLVWELMRWEVDDVEIDEGTMDTIDSTHTDLLYTQEWVRDTLARIEVRYSEQARRRKIMALRQKTVANGCTEEEAHLALAAANEMQRKLDAALAA